MSENCIVCRYLEKFKNVSVEGELKRLAASGTPMADDALRDTRLKICSECKFLNSGDTCLMCGCYVLLRSAILKNKCPKKYW